MVNPNLCLNCAATLDIRNCCICRKRALSNRALLFGDYSFQAWIELSWKSIGKSCEDMRQLNIVQNSWQIFYTIPMQHQHRKACPWCMLKSSVCLNCEWSELWPCRGYDSDPRVLGLEVWLRMRRSHQEFLEKGDFVSLSLSPSSPPRV